jgi:hypothetical protein
MTDESAGAGVEDDGADADVLRRLVGTLPGGMLVIDAVGTVRFATGPAASLVELTPAELAGRSVLDFVDEETAWVYSAAVAMAADFPGDVVGPMRVTVSSPSGTRRSADLWAINRLDDPVLAGIVCLLTPETASLGLGEAIMAMAAGAPFTTVVARVTRAMRGHPTVARAVLVAPGADGWRVVGDDEAGFPPMSGDGPWAVAARTGVRRLAEGLEGLPDEVARQAERLGYRAVWAEPVGTGPESRGVLVLWRATPGRPTPNELNVVHQGASILAMAWREHDRA